VSDDIELRTAWDRTVAPSPRSHEVFDDLVGRHRQPHRRYHGVRHVVWVLRHARQLEAAIPASAGGLHPYDTSYDVGAVSAEQMLEYDSTARPPFLVGEMSIFHAHTRGVGRVGVRLAAEHGQVGVEQHLRLHDTASLRRR